MFYFKAELELSETIDEPVKFQLTIIDADMNAHLHLRPSGPVLC